MSALPAYFDSLGIGSDPILLGNAISAAIHAVSIEFLRLCVTDALFPVLCRIHPNRLARLLRKLVRDCGFSEVTKSCASALLKAAGPVSSPVAWSAACVVITSFRQWRAFLHPFMGSPSDVLRFPLGRRYLADVLLAVIHTGAGPLERTWALAPEHIHIWDAMMRDLCRQWGRWSAFGTGSASVFEYLFQHGARADMDLLLSIATSPSICGSDAAHACTTMVATHLPAGTACDLYIARSTGNTTLMTVLAKLRFTRTLEALCHAGARVHPPPADTSMTPLLTLMSAALVSYVNRLQVAPTVKALLAAGDSINATRPTDGLTPLHLATLMCDRAATLSVLLEAGADANVYDLFGLTPLGLLENLSQPDQESLRLLRAATHVPVHRLAELTAGSGGCTVPQTVKRIACGDHDKVWCCADLLWAAVC
jgi:hypothetical protein